MTVRDERLESEARELVTELDEQMCIEGFWKEPRAVLEWLEPRILAFAQRAYEKGVADASMAIAGVPDHVLVRGLASKGQPETKCTCPEIVKGKPVLPESPNCPLHRAKP